jgi:hypothetical protein
VLVRGEVIPLCHCFLLIHDHLLWACFGLCRLLVSLQSIFHHHIFTRYGGCNSWRSAAPIQGGVFDLPSCIETVIRGGIASSNLPSSQRRVASCAFSPWRLGQLPVHSGARMFTPAPLLTSSPSERKRLQYKASHRESVWPFPPSPSSFSYFPPNVVGPVPIGESFPGKVLDMCTHLDVSLNSAYGQELKNTGLFLVVSFNRAACFM